MPAQDYRGDQCVGVVGAKNTLAVSEHAGKSCDGLVGTTRVEVDTSEVHAGTKGVTMVVSQDSRAVGQRTLEQFDGFSSSSNGMVGDGEPAPGRGRPCA